MKKQPAKTIDLNCDMGEGIGNDEALVPYISSANIATGYHAGDNDTIRNTITLCQRYGVAVGAHPSFLDKENFGRTEMRLQPAVLYDLIYTQLELFAAIVKECGALLHHVKPHGALYNMASRDPLVAQTIVKAIADFDNGLIVFALAGSQLIAAAKASGLQSASEVFADRTYQPNGLLTPRKQADALITDEVKAVQQVLRMIKQQQVVAADGTIVRVDAETICIHGDGPHALIFAKAISEALNENNIQMSAC